MLDAGCPKERSWRNGVMALAFAPSIQLILILSLILSFVCVSIKSSEFMMYSSVF